MLFSAMYEEFSAQGFCMFEGRMLSGILFIKFTCE